MNLLELRNRMRAHTAKATEQRDWYSITNVDTSAAEVRIYDEISLWGITADEFVRDLRALDVDLIDLRLNSPGGLVFDGIAIHNALRDHRATVTTTVDGVAASIASVIAMAGDTVIMNRASTMMIHDAAGIQFGNAADMREMADLLDKLSDTVAGVYASRAGGTVADWRGHMLAETWYNADEAVAAGLADSVAGATPAEQDTTDDSVANRSRLIMARHRALHSERV